MAAADDYANWIVANAAKKGTPEFETVAAAYKDALSQQSAAPAPVAEPSYLERVKANIASTGEAAANLGAGAIRGAGSIGATLLTPVDAAARGLGVQNDFIGRTDRRTAMDAGLQDLGADTNSLAFKTGKLGGEVAGTAGAGGVLGKAAGLTLGRVAPTFAPKIANALATNGFSTGASVAPGMAGVAGDLATRAVGGGLAAGAQVGLVSPGDAGNGALIGAALPPAIKAAGAAAAPVGRALANGITGGPVEAAVQALAKRAKDRWNIDLPADRIADSKPLNAIAAGLNYVPGSGRAGVEKKMIDQLDTALSTTFGENSPNVTMALRKAEGKLGGQFETTLKSNVVKVDDPLLNGLGAAEANAKKELGADGFHAIKSQIDEILTKGANGEIDGQAAYNIKRTLDRIAERNAPEAYHAIQLKKELMGALDRSLGPEQAAAFKTTRQHYGNMLDLQALAQNGAEGGISVGRLANLKNINNPDLQELADIAAQFVKSRESNHGAAQRAFAGMGVSGLGLGLGGPVGAAAGLGGSMLAGRAANAALNSKMLKNALLRTPGEAPALEGLNALAGPAAYRAAPRAGQN